MNIETRPLTAEDFAGYADVGATSYNLPMGRMTEIVQEAATHPMYGAFADGKLAAALLDHRFDLRVNGGIVKSNGIGMLASTPETRRRGLVREMIAGHLRQLQEQGVVLSLLYPFSYTFYARLGWALASRGIEVKAAPGEFAAYGKQLGTVRRLLYSEKDVMDLAPGYTLESVMELLGGLYSAETTMTNLAALRTSDLWLRTLKVTRGRRFVYVWEDGAGAVQGYVIFMVRAEDYPGDLYIREIVGRTPEAWQGLFFFLSCYDSNMRHIVATLPMEHALPDLLGNPRVETSKLSPQVMARAVDVGGLLEARGAAGCDALGECRISIRDRLAPWNEGVWRVAYDGQSVAAEKVSAQWAPAGGGAAQADLETDINGFSQLAVGYRPLAEMLKWGLVRGQPGKAAEFAAKLFPGRTVWHAEYY
jgi:predicted acetyltransferase